MKAASSASYGYNEDPIVSSDVIGMKYGSLFDATQTMVTKIADDLYEVQVVAWYDNENSYTSQMVRTIKYFAELQLISAHKAFGGGDLFPAAFLYIPCYFCDIIIR